LLYSITYQKHCDIRAQNDSITERMTAR